MLLKILIQKKSETRQMKSIKNKYSSVNYRS